MHVIGAIVFCIVLALGGASLVALEIRSFRRSKVFDRFCERFSPEAPVRLKFGRSSNDNRSLPHH